MQKARVEAAKKPSEEKPPYESPAMVTFPYAAHRRDQILTEPLKLENDDFIQDKRSSNMLQVVAIGAFLLLRWSWLSWKKRKNEEQEDEEGGT